MSYVDYPPDVGDYQLVNDEVLNAMKQFGAISFSAAPLRTAFFFLAR